MDIPSIFPPFDVFLMKLQDHCNSYYSRKRIVSSFSIKNIMENWIQDFFSVFSA